MLKKLLKYEIKATARIFLPLYAVLLIYSFIHRFVSAVTPRNWVVPEALSFYFIYHAAYWNIYCKCCYYHSKIL